MNQLLAPTLLRVPRDGAGRAEPPPGLGTNTAETKPCLWQQGAAAFPPVLRPRTWLPASLLHLSLSSGAVSMPGQGSPPPGGFARASGGAVGGLCPSVLSHPLVAPGTGSTLHPLRARQRDCVLCTSSLPSCCHPEPLLPPSPCCSPAAAPSVPPAPSVAVCVSRCRCWSDRGVRGVPSVLTRNKANPVVCANGNTLTVVK